MDTQLKKGLLELCVLASLDKKDSYGYQIIHDIAPYAQISESTLYPILRRLENNQYVSTYTKEYQGRLRKYYKIKKEGQLRIRNSQDDFKQIQKIYEFILGGIQNEKK